MIGKIHIGDCIEIMSGWPDACVDCCVTSPPYWGLRDYGHDGQIGLEESPAEYIAKMVAVMEQVRRVLKPEGTLWLNVGDSYSTQGGSNANPDRQINTGQRGQVDAGAIPDRSRNGVPGLKPKDLCMIPARLAIALCDAGWYLRSEIIWHKPNPMPESVKDRPTGAHEKVYLLAKSQKYYYDADAISEPSTESTVARLNQNIDGQAGSDRANGGYKTNGPMKAVSKRNSFKRDASKRGESICPNSPMPTHRPDREDVDYGGPLRNARNVWTIATKPYSGAHFAVFPPELPRRCILAGCPEGGVVLDPFFGSGTTGMVAESLGRQWVGCELNPEYAALARKRTQQRGIFTT